MNPYLTVQCRIKVQFYDVDSMNVVWHGNYIRYFEEARSALFDKIGFSYLQIQKSDFTLPIVEFQIKYIQPLFLHQNILVEANLIEYENRIKILFTIFDEETKKLLTKASSIQVAVKEHSQELEFEIPDIIQQKIQKVI